MFGIDPKMIAGLQQLQTQIQLFMASVNATLQRIETRLDAIETALKDQKK